MFKRLQFRLLRKAQSKHVTASPLVATWRLILWLLFLLFMGMAANVYSHDSANSYMTHPISVDGGYEQLSSTFALSIYIIFAMLLLCVFYRGSKNMLLHDYSQRMRKKLRERMKKRLTEDKFEQWEANRYPKTPLKQMIKRGVLALGILLLVFPFVAINTVFLGVNVSAAVHMALQSKITMFAAPIAMKVSPVWNVYSRDNNIVISPQFEHNEKVLLEDGAAFAYIATHSTTEWSSTSDNADYRAFIDNAILVFERFEKFDAEGRYAGEYPKDSFASVSLRTLRETDRHYFYDRMATLKTRVNDRDYIENEITSYNTKCDIDQGESRSDVCKERTLYYLTLLKFNLEGESTVNY